MKKKVTLYIIVSSIIILLALVSQAKNAAKVVVHSSGTKTKTLVYQGTQRSYSVYLPKGYKNSRVWPVVLALHGGAGDAKDMAELTELNTTADREGFIVVYPQGTGKTFAGKTYGTWNAGACCPPASEQKVDDVGFISQVISKIEKDYSIDKRKIYVTGFSNGAQMAYRLACSPVSAKIAAIAPVSGISPLESIPDCKPLRKIPILHIHGQSDPCVPVKGGTCGGCFGKVVEGVAGATGPGFTWSCPSLPTYFSEWLKINGLPKEPLRVTNQGPLTCQYYGWRKDATSMQLCTVDEAGHTWSGGNYGTPCNRLLSGSCVVVKKTLGKLEERVSNNNLMWQFFKDHPKPSLAAMTGGYIMGGLWNLISD